ncbi:hypothetical protein O181_028509 [Austropuccinia psidii MF-1]|uniref:GAG-pre-integrase domain-containing protein n=1 Tax=Austropuccinia psidii MF-1 TaxID=1389203 RepID=A0A9Q3CQT6_9BASI|nr:hypothetical protein [Austropuccinia psidii MF-1]
MFNIKEVFTSFTSTNHETITTHIPCSNLKCKGFRLAKILINRKIFTLKECFYAPKPTKNLVGLLELCKNSITLTNNGSELQLTQNSDMLISGNLINKLIILTFNQPFTSLTEGTNRITWYQHLGHAGSHVMNSLSLAPLYGTTCDICTKGRWQ